MNGNTVVIIESYSSGIELVKVAKELGYSIIGLFFNKSKEEYLGNFIEQFNEWLSEIYFVNSIETIISKLKGSKHNISAVIAGSEIAVNVSDIIAERLGLPCNPSSTISARRNKGIMKDVVKSFGLRCANYKKCYNLEDVLEFANEIRYPVVVKDPEGSGSYNVFVCENSYELRENYQKIMESTDRYGKTKEYCLTEEYIQGIEYAVNLFANGTKFFVTDIWEYQKVSSSVADNLYYNVILCPINDIQKLPTYFKHKLHVKVNDYIEPTRNLTDIPLITYLVGDKDVLWRDAE